jgi:DNA-binding Xre family transcriptional regulator
MRWKIPELLKEHDITAYQFMRESGLAQGTAYALALGASERVYLETLPKVRMALETLTGKPIGLTDIIDFAENDYALKPKV